MTLATEADEVRPPGKIPTGTIPGWPDEFESHDRLVFKNEIGLDEARFWNSRIRRRVDMFPMDFAEALCRGLPGEHKYTYDEINHQTQIVKLEMSGATPVAETIWLHGQDTMIGDGLVNETGVFVEDKYQSQGIGRHIASNVYDMAVAMGLNRITL
jgi:GNAT superfamily N-acetyltransferase